MTKLAATLSALTFVCVTAGTAAANVVVATDGEYAVRAQPAEEPELPRRYEGRVGMLIGGSDVGDADGFSMGVSGGWGYRIGDVTLRSLFDYYRVGDSNDEINVRRGRAARLGAAVRYSFANTGDQQRERAGVGIDFWGEAGIGYEYVMWRQGGVLSRPSGELAVGFELDGQGERARSGRRRHVGYFMAFRTLIAQGPAMEGTTAACGGPCTEATKPSRTDVSMFFELGLHWGR